MIKHIYLEKNIEHSPHTARVLKAFEHLPVTIIDRYDEYWGRFKKPYLHKRTDLNLFLAEKKGEIVKEAPDAYGTQGEPHFYFINAYNCIYECQYCYLQGYFNTPDLVLFLNYQEIIRHIENKIQSFPNAWFHAGEFSDSLAMSQITQEWAFFWKLFAQYPEAKLELRTKSNNIKALLDLPAQANCMITFSLSPDPATKSFDLKTPRLSARLKAIKALVAKGHPIGIHFDPIIYQEGFAEYYQAIITELANMIPEKQWVYTSLGVVRFSQNDYREVEKNYPNSALLSYPFEKTRDDKYKYHQPLRVHLLNTLRNSLLQYQDPEKVYFCME
jgi:spore photoproduct lyase